MAIRQERITRTESNVLIKELINAGYARPIPKSKSNLSRACHYKPTLCIPALQEAMQESSKLNHFFIGMIQRHFAIRLVNFLKDEHGIISKAKGILPIKPE